MKWLHLFKSFFIALLYKPFVAINFANRLLFKKNISAKGFKLQVFGPLVIKETMDICRAIGLEPFLNYGSLLGYYRNNALIDTDNDIDFGIFEQDKPKLPQLKEAMIARGYKVRIENKLEVSFISTKYGNVIIDFWIHYLHQRSNKIFSGCIFHKMRKVSIFPFSPEIFHRLQSVRFHNIQVYIPHTPEKYLVNVYGKDWRIPLDKEYSFDEKTKFIYPNKLMITESEFKLGNFL